MNDSESFQRASAAAHRFLSYRARSKAEVRTRLRRKFPSDVVERVIEDLIDQNLINDSSFAELWKNSRESFRPRSASAVRRELISKGVDRSIADTVVQEIDDYESAYRAASRFVRRLDTSDFEGFRRKLWGHLQRRGFSNSVARHTVERLWNERDDGGECLE